jgi:hypothetical protein
MRHDRVAQTAKKSRFFGCAALATALLAPMATAQTVVSVENNQAMGLRYNFATATVATNPNGDSVGKAGVRNNISTNDAGKAWISFDLSSIFAIPGQSPSDLTSVNFKFWDANGPTRLFDVAGLLDGSLAADNTTLLEDWTPDTNTDWFTAPANVATIDPANVTPPLNDPARYAFEAAKIHGGAPIWRRESADPAGHDVAVAGHATMGQAARYESIDNPTDNAAILDFLKADTNGKVTFMISNGPANNNHSVFIGSAIAEPALITAWTNVDTQLQVVFSPTLELTFGGATATPGDFNGDGLVNSVDLDDPMLGWRARYGVDLDGDDFLEWQRHLGSPAGISAIGPNVQAIPEPSTVILLGALVGTLIGCSRKKSAA